MRRKVATYTEPALDWKLHVTIRKEVPAHCVDGPSRMVSLLQLDRGKAVQAVPIEAPLESPRARTGRPPPVDTATLKVTDSNNSRPKTVAFNSSAWIAVAPNTRHPHLLPPPARTTGCGDLSHGRHTICQTFRACDKTCAVHLTRMHLAACSLRSGEPNYARYSSSPTWATDSEYRWRTSRQRGRGYGRTCERPGVAKTVLQATVLRWYVTTSDDGTMAPLIRELDLTEACDREDRRKPDGVAWGRSNHFAGR